MNNPTTKKVGRRKTGKITVAVRMSPATKARLDRVVTERKLDSLSVYAEQAIEAQLDKDAVPGGVDFRNRFSHPPKGPRVGDRFVDLILSEREKDS